MKLQIFEMEKDGLIAFVIGYGGYSPNKLFKTLVSTEKGIEPIWVTKRSLAWSEFSRKKADKIFNILRQDINCPEYDK
jgi:hypothetical protein